MADGELQLLWSLISSGWISHSLENSRLTEIRIHESLINLPSDIQDLVIACCTDYDDATIGQLALLAVKRFYFDAVRHITLIALLVTKRFLSVKQAATLLPANRDPQGAMSASVRRVFDVAWLINQDAKDGFMQPEQDDLLLEALREVLASQEIK